MHNDKLIRYVKRWRDLEQRQKDLDYERSVFARDLRAEFKTDEQFIKWCADELGLNGSRAQELLLRAAAAKVVPSPTVWKRVGGFKEIRAVELLPRQEQVTAIEAAKASGRSIRSIVRERLPKAEASTRATPYSDAEQFARFILASFEFDSLPSPIRQTLAKYPHLVTDAANKRRAARGAA